MISILKLLSSYDRTGLPWFSKNFGQNSLRIIRVSVQIVQINAEPLTCCYEPFKAFLYYTLFLMTLLNSNKNGIKFHGNGKISHKICNYSSIKLNWLNKDVVQIAYMIFWRVHLCISIIKSTLSGRGWDFCWISINLVHIVTILSFCVGCQTNIPHWINTIDAAIVSSPSNDNQFTFLFVFFFSLLIFVIQSLNLSFMI